MGRAPSRTSSVSLISVDPAVASQIANTSTAQETRKSSNVGSNKAPNSRTNSSRTNDKGTPRKHDQARKDSGRGRGNSLRRVKNSTEVLRQRTARDEVPELASYGMSNTREGRNFTVGNVGTGGFLYLKPAVQKAPNTTRSPPIALPPTPPKSAPLPRELDDTVDNIGVTDSTTPARPYTPSTALHRSTTNAGRSQNTSAGGRRQGRSYSFSSVDERKSLDSSSGAFRIVINRSTPTRPQVPPNLALPTLEVPIPHYRLGTPRFSTQGTAILRSSINTRTSAAPSADSNRSPSFAQPDLLFPAPPGSRGHGLLNSSGIDRDFELGLSPDQMKNRASESSGSTISDQPPLTPTLFDGLAHMHDDPSVVRYSAKTGEIVAATPARIVAQISSESFMDYELVSDFFLTFRAYMSTRELLDLLLARLRWAINRLEDDGRIVRIRTFAALRHWILNYFMDDFVLNRRLRVRFCQQINDMYAEVHARPAGGSSDLKILQDLKRCWNGRCSLYWNSPHFAIDSSLDREVMPGGFVGSLESSNSEYSMLDPEKEAVLAMSPITPRQRHAQSWFGNPPEPNVPEPQYKHDSAFVAFGPESPRSELSVQPNSCSIPMILSRLPLGSSDPAKGPHPVPVQVRRQKAPSNLAVSTHAPYSHKRSANSLDSSRKSTPVPAQRVIIASPYAGSLIRGQVYPPASAIVEVLSSVTAKTYHDKVAFENLDAAQMKSGSPTNPAVKSIFGSIRRALGSKHGMGDITLLTVSDGPQQGPVRGKIFTRTLASTKSHDELRRMVDSRPVRSQMRIDLLCAAVVQSYEMAIASTSTGANKQVVNSAAGGTVTKHLIKPTTHTADEHSKDLEAHRFYSQATAQSGSILIVDDTRLDLPSMSGALPASNFDPSDNEHGRGFPPRMGLPRLQSTSLDPPAVYVASQRSSGLFGTEKANPAALPHGTNAITANRNMRSSNPELTAASTENERPVFGTPSSGHKRVTASTAASSATMRRVASFGSTVDRHGAESSIGATRTSVSSPQDEEDDDAEMVKSHTLRRRPGGNLKQIQHVHDLEPTPRAQSFDSAIAATDSTGGSLVIMANKETGVGESPQHIPGQRAVSMINTHSSQHLRPSFEAAIAGFSAIPDDHDGGLEATLLKLEGKYDPASPSLSHGLAEEEDDHTPRRETFYFPEAENRTSKHSPAMEDDDDAQARKPQIISPRPITRMRATPDILQPSLSVAPADSYNLIPLLERGHPEELPGPDQGRVKTQHQSITHLPGSSRDDEPSEPSAQMQLSAGAQHVADPTAARTQNETSTFLFPDPSASVRSFLLDEDEDLSDLSSEISVDIINQSDLVERPFSPMIAAPGTARSGLELPSHPLGHYSDPHLVNPKAPGHIAQRMPPTPDPSPKLKQEQRGWKPPIESGIGAQFPSPVSSGLGHIPFVLACDSQILAQQLTLVEKAALSEVEWIDLVDMRWDSKAAKVSDWVEYLSVKNNKGIDLVITRFNLVVKWALSEIMLTNNIHERARTITKYIHTAAHARRLHNYATMLQLTIALTSTDCTRLSKTWELITAPDRSLLKNMEALIQPLRNFHDLRAEMESADLSEGCIPFIGLYIHDLTYNAQKPSQVAGTRESEPLVNFERYRTAATIIKGLLRLIDASSRYEIPPLEGVIERCLWMAALDDTRIRSLSKLLETQE